ncbi:MAG: ferrous iron transport protein A [Candidatus Electrothrix sp. AR4]|nr:ferrous iron transport protein A [Candidatus Electrothrix sp. AR4]
MRKMRYILSPPAPRKKECGVSASSEAQPLSECCGCNRVRVCKVSGDRSVCGRMANMGVLPGTVIELICPARGQKRKQCMVKINGGTLSLDALTARNILVQPI